MSSIWKPLTESAIWKKHKESAKTAIIIVLLTLILIFIGRESVSPITQDITVTLANRIDWFLGSLGVFSTILLALMGYAVVTTISQQRQIDDDVREIRKKRSEAEENAERIKYAAEGVSGIELRAMQRKQR